MVCVWCIFMMYSYINVKNAPDQFLYLEPYRVPCKTHMTMSDNPNTYTNIIYSCIILSLFYYHLGGGQGRKIDQNFPTKYTIAHKKIKSFLSLQRHPTLYGKYPCVILLLCTKSLWYFTVVVPWFSGKKNNCVKYLEVSLISSFQVHANALIYATKIHVSKSLQLQTQTSLCHCHLQLSICTAANTTPQHAIMYQIQWLHPPTLQKSM